jgi:hypothetical protein
MKQNTRTTVKVKFEDGNSFITEINLSFDEAKRYYVGNYFNLGTSEDKMCKCTSIKEISRKEA